MEKEVLKGRTLLVVDDEIDLRDIVASELEYMGAKVFQAGNVSVARKFLEDEKIDLIVSDIRMPGGTGIDLLEHVKKQNVQTPPVILITGFADITVENAFHKGAEALINKPFRLDDLIKMVQRYTAPYEARFKEERTHSNKKIEAQGEVKLGRGGFSIRMDTNGRKFEVGEQVQFDFVHHGKNLKGEAVCRWFRPVDQLVQKAAVGLEILFLEDSSTEHFKDFAHDTKLIPYIPSIERD